MRDPLVVAVINDVVAMLGPWRWEIVYLLGVGGLVTLLICLVVGLVARKTLRDIRQSQKRLRDERCELDTALQYMSQGLCMFDAAQRLVLCNQRYLQMYGLSADVGRPGVGFRALIEHRKATGSFPGDAERYCSDLLAAIARGGVARHFAELDDGRVIELVSQPKAGGGWISTHNDITRQRRAEEEIKAARAEAERAEREARAAHARLLEAFEIVPEGLACSMPTVATCCGIGATRSSIRTAPNVSAPALASRTCCERVSRAGGILPPKVARRAWLAERLARLRATQSVHEQQLPGDRWLRVEERRTADGGSIGVRIDITDLKRREASFRLLFEDNPLPMYVFDVESFRFVAVNDAALCHHGSGREQFLAMTVFDIRPAEDRAQLMAALQSGEEHAAAECARHRNADGTIVDVDVYSRTFNYQGRPARLSVVIDTSERRRAERERDCNRELLDLIVENVPSMIAVKDARNLRYVLINKAGEDDLGSPRSTIIGRTAHEVFPKTSAGYVAALDQKLLRSGNGPLVSEHSIETFGRGKRTSVSKRLVIRDENGEPKYLLSVSDDVTDRRRLEQERDRNREFLDCVIENVPATIFVRDARDGRFVLVNRAAELLWGLPRDKVIGRTPRDIFPEKDADLIAEHDRTLLQSDVRLLVREHTVRTPNNGTRLVNAKRLSIRDAEGAPRYLLGVLEDLTESRAIERQLQQARKMEAVGNLTGGLAHDFNNLLTIIIGNLDLLLTDVAGNQPAVQKVETILEAAERGADLTHQMLAFSRRQPLSPRRIDINGLIGSTTRLLARTLGENITINLRLVDDLWPVIADAGQLEAALVNIAINARDAMPEGGVLTLVTGKSRLDADDVAHHPEVAIGDYVMIELRDTGAGMPPAVLTQIFEPFFTTKEPGKGTGLGLSMVYGFMKQSGGHVSADSRVGEGTTFRLYLPRAAETEAASLRPEISTPRPAAKREVILAVDDNPAVRATAIMQLRELGYHVLEADNAQSALEMLERAEPIDLLFTDIVMPGPINGRELATRARLRRPDLKVVFTSGFPGTSPTDGEGAEARDILLGKPYRKHDLADAVHQALHASW